MARYGVNPWKQLMLLRKYNLESRVYPLGIGRRRIGSYKWIITKVSNDLKTFYKNGKVTEVMAGVTFKEYPYKKGSSKKKKVVKSKKKKKTPRIARQIPVRLNQKRKTKRAIPNMSSRREILCGGLLKSIMAMVRSIPKFLMQTERRQRDFR